MLGTPARLASSLSTALTADDDVYFPIVALMPPSRDVRLADMRPVARAIEGEKPLLPFCVVESRLWGGPRARCITSTITNTSKFVSRLVCFGVPEAEFYAEEGMAAVSAGKRKNASEDVLEGSIVTDGEVACEVLELMGRDGKVRVQFNCECRLPFLVFQIKDVGRFCAVEVVAEGKDGTEYTLELSSRATVARVGRQKAALPLMLGKGWNYCCLDVEDILHTAFGAKLAFTTRVAVKSSCRISKVFFQDKRYEDRELPDFLRVIK